MQGPLEGIRILDFTRATAGPYGGQLLADLGAEVIKIEPPDSPARKLLGVLDRNVGDKYSFNINGIGTHFLALNRSKKSVALNMRTGKGRTIFQELACKSDVIYDNFRPEVPKKMRAGSA